MPNLKIGTYIKVLKMKDEPDYKGKIGKVVLIDDANQIHGTWAVAHSYQKLIVSLLCLKRERLYSRCARKAIPVFRE